MSVGDPTAAAMGRPDCLEPEDAPRGSAAPEDATFWYFDSSRRAYPRGLKGCAQHFTVPAIAAKAQQCSSAARGTAAATTWEISVIKVKTCAPRGETTFFTRESFFLSLPPVG